MKQIYEFQSIQSCAVITTINDEQLSPHKETQCPSVSPLLPHFPQPTLGSHESTPPPSVCLFRTFHIPGGAVHVHLCPLIWSRLFAHQCQ